MFYNTIDLRKWLNEGVDISTTINFLDSLKKGLSILLPSTLLGNRVFYWNFKPYKKISRDELSIFLGLKRYSLKEIISRAKKDSTYLISLEYIDLMEYNLKLKLKTYLISQCLIDEFIDKNILAYARKHNPPRSNRFKSRNFHPNLKENYFKEINTIEKAYWLGLLWADGWISKKKLGDEKNPNFTIGFKQSVKHEKLIKDYCSAIGFNYLYLKKYQDKKSGKWYYLAQLMNNRFVNPLIKYGFIVGKQKSLNLELPILKNTSKIINKALYLGFLLGYYDGDGTKGRTYITTGSIMLVKQIKYQFKIHNDVLIENFQKKDGTQGIIYRLALGRDLMCEMLNNYKYSFKPKRKAIGPVLLNSFDKLVGNQKREMIKKKLKWEEFRIFILELGRNLEFSYKNICKKCQYFDVEIPLKREWLLN